MTTCVRCRVLPATMVSPADLCRPCWTVWFDGGENPGRRVAPMRARRFAAAGIIGRGAVTREEALDARSVVRDFLEALVGIAAPIGAAARKGAKEVTDLARHLGRFQPPSALTRGARWGRSRPARASR